MACYLTSGTFNLLRYLQELTMALQTAREACRVPLFLDLTSSHAVDTFLGYQRTQQIDMGQVTELGRRVKHINVGQNTDEWGRRTQQQK